MKKEIKKYLAEIGRKGGKSKSEKKIRAVKENLKKARKIRGEVHHGQTRTGEENV